MSKKSKILNNKKNPHKMEKTLEMDSSNSYYPKNRDKNILALKGTSFSKSLDQLPENELLDVLKTEPMYALVLSKVSTSILEQVCLFDSEMLRYIPLDTINEQMVLNGLQCNFNKYSHIFDDRDFSGVLSQKKFSDKVADVIIENFIKEISLYNLTKICAKFSDEKLKIIISKRKDVLGYLFNPSFEVIEFAVQKDFNSLKAACEFNHIDNNKILKLILKTIKRRPEAGEFVPFLADYQPQRGVSESIKQKMIHEVSKRLIIDEKL